MSKKIIIRCEKDGLVAKIAEWTALPKELSLMPACMSGGSQSTVTAVPGKLVSMSALALMCTHTQLKK